jgi:hypothetical protein
MEAPDVTEQNYGLAEAEDGSGGMQPDFWARHSGRISHSARMDKREDHDRLRRDEVDEELTIGRREREMAHEERQLAREMKELEDADEGAQKEIGEELRREHWGREPERPVRWPNRGRK